MELPRGRLRAVAAGTLSLALAALGGALFTTVANAAKALGIQPKH